MRDYSLNVNVPSGIKMNSGMQRMKNNPGGRASDSNIMDLSLLHKIPKMLKRTFPRVM
jgi:hypothetical protein